MLSETHHQLKTLVQSQLIVSFVLLPSQKNVYDAFVNQLHAMPSIDDTPTTIPFDRRSM